MSESASDPTTRSESASDPTTRSESASDPTTRSEPASDPTGGGGRADLTALQLDVPEADRLLAAVGREGRRGVTLLRPAHISLGYPWLAPAAASLAIDRVADALASTPPLMLRFEAVERFGPDPEGRAVLHLVPEPIGAVREVARRADVELHAPHLSLARVTAEAAPGTADELATVVRPLLPLEARVRTASFAVRRDGVWRVERTLALGARRPNDG